jgi:hypothetical protein
MMREVWMKRLAAALGINFAAYYPEYQSRGEIELFMGHKATYTPIHFDFQENFTVQLQGSKTWKLARSGITSPLRGYSPHYSKVKSLEAETKVL